MLSDYCSPINIYFLNRLTKPLVCPFLNIRYPPVMLLMRQAPEDIFPPTNIRQKGVGAVSAIVLP